MGVLVQRVPWTRQPQYPVGIDKHNPLTQALCFLWSPGLGRNGVVLGPPMSMTTVTAVTRPTEKGQAAYLNADNQSYESAAGSYALTTSDGAGTGTFTLLAFARPIASTSQRSLISQRAPASPFRQVHILANTGTNLGASSGSIAFITYDSTHGPQAVSAGKVDGNWHVYVGVRPALTTVHDLYVDGAFVVTASDSVTDNVIGTNSANGVGSGPVGFFDTGTTDIVLTAMWNRELLASEVADVSNNPWQLFEP